MHVCEHEHTCLNAHINVSVYADATMHTCVHVCMRARACAHMHVCAQSPTDPFTFPLPLFRE